MFRFKVLRILVKCVEAWGMLWECVTASEKMRKMNEDDQVHSNHASAKGLKF